MGWKLLFSLPGLEPIVARGHESVFLRLLYIGCGTMIGCWKTKGVAMDVWFIALTVVLALSTWGAIALFGRLLKRP